MVKTVINYFKTGENKPVLSDDPEVIKKVYNQKRWSILYGLVFGYGFFYICRLSFAVAKKPMLEAGVLDIKQMGIVGAVLMFVYAIGKLTNGFLADRANIRKFISIALLCSAIINMLFGAVSYFWFFVILWAFNGWFQSIGSAPCVVSLCQWFSNKERGTYYGIWAASHNIGEGLTYVGTAVLVSWFGWRWGFWGPGIICIFVAFILFRLLADRPETCGLPHISDYKKDYSAGKPSKASIGKLQMEVLKTPALWIVGVSCALMYMVRYALIHWGVLYLQEIEHYSLMQASFMVGVFPITGMIGAAICGFISDKFFNAKRNFPTLIYGVINLGSLFLLFYSPPGHIIYDIIAMLLFGFSIGGLIVFLAGLIAIDFCSKRAAGAVKGTIGMMSYIAAGIEELVTGYLIDMGKGTANGEVVYNFDYVIYFWIGASFLSIVLAALVWNVKPKE